MAPLLTIGLPVYNGMPWLPETIASIRRQTYQDFAALVIDDGSSDGTAEYLRSIRDPRFRIVRQENRGITATLNRMLEEVEGPWLVRHDTDDVAFPQRLARTVDAITRFPDAGMFFSHAAHYQNGYTLGRLKTSEGEPADLRKLTQSGYIPSICHSTVVLNVAKVRALGGYRFDLNVEEYDLYWRMALAHDLRCIRETLVGYRINGGSVSAKDLREQAVNVLYIQYLLLSTIWGFASQRRESVKSCLETMVDMKMLAYRRHMREALTSLGNQRYGSAFANVIRAVVSTPGPFFGRMLYELGQPQIVCVGEDVKVFANRQCELWPDSLDTQRCERSSDMKSSCGKNKFVQQSLF
jgi:glycosyltransferase involved in cell wall biosynthesis